MSKTKTKAPKAITVREGPSLPEAEDKEFQREETKKLQKKSSKISTKQMDAAKKKQKIFYKMKMKAVERFSVAARQKLGSMLKGVGVIGSLARGDFVPGSDIDVLVVIDDTKREVPSELKEKLLAMLNDMGRKIDKKMQVQIHTLTEMFQYAKEGDNIIYNFLRHMKIIYDGGVLTPFTRMLKAGEIKPSKEAMMRSLDGAEYYMKKVEQYVEWILERYYRGITWSGNAYIMSLGEKPCSVPEMPIVLQSKVDKGLLPQEVPAIAAEVIKAFKAVEHGDRKPNLKEVTELESKVRHFMDILKKEIVGSMVSKSVGTAIKSKIKTMPKIIFEFGKHRSFVWLLDGGIYMAVYKNEKLDAVYKSQIKEGKVSTFKAAKNDELFKAMEQSSLKPLINTQLIERIYKNMPATVRVPVEKLAIEYPGRAMIDLTSAVNLKP
ncbi:MAG: nucleotidyltransferase domain-containing protein [Candidatus Altiarchaeota archaeon]|nr:nucleotidyltransferase domain-containing protein [Candidatus Altiarchaeota archaeon]